MQESELSDSESAEAVSSEEEAKNETSNEKGGERNEGKLLQYERERLKRIEENKKRMEALGLHKMASSFIGSVKKAYNKKVEKKGKKKLAEEDEEYNPTEEEMSSSGKEDDEFSVSHKKKVKRNTSTPRKQGPAQKLTFDSDFVEDDDALMQAIALSLQDSAGFLDLKSSSPSQISGVHLRDISTSKIPDTNFIETSSNKRNENFYIQNDSGKRKKRKPITSRERQVQMSEDELLIHFFQFDETGKGWLTLRDVQRLATAHDFTWSDKEMADMIHFFDSDGDGKISFDEFRKIVGRCNMLKGPESSDNGV